MFNFLKRTIYKWSMQGRQSMEEKDTLNLNTVGSMKAQESSSFDGIRLNITKAHGGYVVSYYNSKKVRNQIKGAYSEDDSNHLHLVLDGENLGESLEKIITYEGMKE